MLEKNGGSNAIKIIQTNAQNYRKKKWKKVEKYRKKGKQKNSVIKNS